jgi:hypothetical protein
MMVVSESNLEDVVFGGNNASYGGGMYVYSTGSVRMDGATVINNTTTERSGGVRLSAGLPEITAADFGGKIAPGPKVASWMWRAGSAWG